MKIDIKGLKKEKIIVLLFNNVYRKSLAAKATENNLNQLFETPDTSTFILTEVIVRDLLSKNKDKIEYLGPVKFMMDFSENEIDVSEYDKIHNTGSANIQTAEACISTIKFLAQSLKVNSFFVPEAANKILDTKFSSISLSP